MSQHGDVDGWTHVPRTKKTRKAQITTPGVPPPSRDLSLDTITRDFNAKLKTWRSSECRASLLRMLGRIRPDGGWQLETAVCLGSGSLSRDNLECRRRSLWQVVAFVDIAEILNIIGDTYAQEPTFTELDYAFLKTVGVEVLDKAIGENSNGLGPTRDVLGNQTLLFEPFVDMNAAMVNDMLEKNVGLYIGTSIKGLMEKGARASASKESRERLRADVEAGELAKQFLKTREMYKFPVFDADPNVFEGTGVYWRQQSEDDDG